MQVTQDRVSQPQIESFRPASDLYENLFQRLRVSTDFENTLKSFNTTEHYNSLSPEDRLAHRVFMMTYLPLKAQDTAKKARLLLHLLLLKDPKDTPSPTGVEQLSEDLEETKYRTSQRKRRPTEKYQQYQSSQPFKRERKKAPFTPEREQQQRTFNSPSSGIKEAYEEHVTPGTRARMLGDLKIDSNIFN